MAGTAAGFESDLDPLNKGVALAAETTPSVPLLPLVSGIARSCTGDIFKVKTGGENCAKIVVVNGQVLDNETKRNGSTKYVKCPNILPQIKAPDLAKKWALRPRRGKR